ncbi:phosphogluconate dehydrogenase (NADP(+)-dependent, decarboxylating) [Oleiphilus sp. HI0009]|uniref:decarboxylating NADP(+)-dependent phosphogluconate dehydrogenase n=2 Tax=Oleiphilus TaxID=141450 RepID=UPI0007C38CAE|nr:MULTISPECIES: decarboxylating NADP(+)-dependent phosphogluconate dehydrogenase [unclassified Oleiphilus]KZX82390.1 phosphogluconate dehydrogenase (NADP(+)-dependent, decarboxylating) [Oleiphilus sp. HI0009]MCH2159715.1 decarboxylating NADP(+)-dependent phosphogluconate dehydrogenase [Oleiphilaceae bacterium]KZY64342.1 phosphogluconate dehydrogenase (NADP(+)-dependent, decarboxylating) [Oleiphilus sp. HI0066]KZY66096.1 phosphogluconate dehydrogenase (NADP(+)-dependent, decarboxylating) [Oleip
MSADIGVIGLAVMGQNLILNMDNHGFEVVAYNRSKDKVSAFLSGAAKGTNIKGAHSIEELVNALSTPRKIMLMVRAGQVVDDVIAQLIPHLEQGDIIIDGGNSNFEDSSRRLKELSEQGILFLGAGVSGGEEGARHGPSIMPGGSQEAWPHLKPILQSIAAKTRSGEPCCDWVGQGGAGHFVKMVHNGIEYGDMQLIAESYDFLRIVLGLNNDEISAVLGRWNETELDSYLVEISRDILAFKDEQGNHLLDRILDKAGQKGTGKWTGINALDLGVPLTLISESVFARCISALKDQRTIASKHFSKPSVEIPDNKDEWIEIARKALLASKIISYAQGFMLMKAASDEHGWELNYGNVALMWREGCIIRSVFLEQIRDAFASDGQLDFLGLAPYFNEILQDCLPAWRKLVAKSVESGVPVPCIGSALSFIEAYSREKLPANLIQAQRDYFGAHTYQLDGDETQQYYHTDWTGRGGDTSSSSYDV